MESDYFTTTRLAIAALALTLLIAASLTPPIQAGQPGSQNKPIWSGQSGGFAFQWTAKDIIAKAQSRPAFSAKALFDKEVSELKGASKEDEESVECSYEWDLAVLSVTGSIMSYEKAEYHFCAGLAHPSLNTSFVAVDVSRPERALKLTDLFPDADVLKALLADAVVKKAIATVAGAKAPKTTDELVKLLSESESECEYGFFEDLLTRFAFHHLERDRVAVRIGLSHGFEPCRGKLTQLGVLLPVPESLRTSLAAAAAGREGFLMREKRNISNNLTTALTASYKTGGH